MNDQFHLVHHEDYQIAILKTTQAHSIIYLRALYKKEKSKEMR